MKNTFAFLTFVLIAGCAGCTASPEVESWDNAKKSTENPFQIEASLGASESNLADNTDDLHTLRNCNLVDPLDDTYEGYLNVCVNIESNSLPLLCLANTQPLPPLWHCSPNVCMESGDSNWPCLQCCCFDRFCPGT